MAALFLYSRLMLRFFLLVLSLFLVSCATTTYEQKTVQDYDTDYGVYLSLWYGPGELKYWTEKDLENFEMGLESGELNGGYWFGTNGDSFLDSDKGLSLIHI